MNNQEQIKSIMTKWTKQYANVIADIDDVRVTFNNRSKRVLAKCSKAKKRITYSMSWLIANQENLELMKPIIVHECCHLVHPNHSPKFKQLCRKWGLNEYLCKGGSNHPMLKKPPHKYQAICKKCGQIHKKYRISTKETCCGYCSNEYKEENKLIFVEVGIYGN